MRLLSVDVGYVSGLVEASECDNTFLLAMYPGSFPSLST